MSLNIIVSVDRCNNILEQALYLYDIKEKKTFDRDMAVIMDKYTWEQIPLNLKPLKNRVNIIVDVDGLIIGTPDTIWIRSIDQAIYQYRNFETFVIGGEYIMNHIYENYIIDHIYMTLYDVVEIDDTYEDLGQFPQINLDRYKIISDEQLNDDKNVYFRDYIYNDKMNIFL